MVKKQEATAIPRQRHVAEICLGMGVFVLPGWTAQRLAPARLPVSSLSRNVKVLLRVTDSLRKHPVLEKEHNFRFSLQMSYTASILAVLSMLSPRNSTFIF